MSIPSLFVAPNANQNLAIARRFLPQLQPFRDNLAELL